MSSDGPETRQATLNDVPVLLFIRGLAFLTVMMGLVVSLHWYLGARLIRDAGLAEPFAAAGWTALWVAFGSIFGGFIGGRLLPRSVARPLQWIGFLWMGAFGLLISATGLSDLVLLVARQFTTVDATWLQWRAIAVMGVVVPALAYGFVVARAPAIKRVTVPIKNLPKAFEGYRIAQISDVHIGETLTKAFAQQVTDTVNSLKPDAVAVTGDLIDGSVAKLKSEVAPLAGLRGRDGVFYVTGNHEYYHGGSSWEAEGARLGMTVLHNTHVVVTRDGEQLVIGGVPDVEGGRFSAQHEPDAAKTFEGAPVGAPRVLLAHQPRFAKRVKDTRVDLMLSGHTHGGQIFPFMFFVKLQQPVIGGFETLWGVPTYTSNGTGYWGPPFRVGPRGEVTELTLVRAA
ncbi:MAG: metallophosphoesterase [Archangiaceae bacterium]|nr:metallophosphoesterase [Archangiaceae bacterium]